MELVAFVKGNYLEIAKVVLGLIAVAEIVTRLTPTKKDDGAVERIGSIVKKVFDFLKVPNNLK